MTKIEYNIFKHSALNQNQSKRLFEHFINEGLIDQNTAENDFLYYFCGVGNEPLEKLKWRASVILLAIYIKAIGDHDYRPEWKVAENVFEGIKASSLRDNYSKPFSKDSSRSFEAFFDNKRRVETLVANL